MTINLNTQIQKAFSRLEDLSQCDIPSHELTSKLLSELNSALHELQTTAVELLEQNEEMAASRQTLEEERCRYQELFDFAPDAYLVTDLEGIIIDANSAAAILFNASKSLLIGEPLAIYVRREEQLDFRTRLAKMKQGTVAQIENWELIMLSRRRTTFPVSITVGKVIASRAGTTELRWLLRNITKRKQMDEENAAQAAELVLANKELAYQKKLAYQNEVNGKLVKELIIANKELAFQNEEKEKRATELVVAKELALISVERLNEVQRLAHLGSWEMDIATGVSFWSDEFFRICGFEPNSFKPTAEIGMTIIHPDDRARTTAEIEKAINELCDYKIEKRIVRPDGSVRYVSSIGEIECDKDNKPISLQGFILDITDRKNNEVELRRIKERLQEAQEFAHLGYWELDIISKKYLWSDELFRIFGFNPQGFVPTLNDFLEIIHSKDKEIILKAIEEPLNICEFDLRIIRQDNETIWIHEKIRYEYDVSGKPVRIYGVVQDITQRKLSELKLKESEEKFKELAENLGEVIWVRQNEHLVYINPAYEKVWGRTCQSLYDNPHSFIDEIHPEDRERIVQAYLGESRTLQGLFEAQYRIIRPDGSIRWIWDRALPICDENGRMIRCVGIADDITKIKDLEEEALKNTMEKEMARLDKLSLVGAVAAGIGHEIRNPMTTVRGYLQLLGSKEEFAKYNAQFSLMIDELDRANSIITEFLSLAKDRVVELSMQSLKEIVENIFPLIQADGVLSDKYIQMELEEVPEIPLDKKEIHQLILNLVLNGSQAMSPAGIMKIKTYMDKDEIVLAVQDDGGGIAPEALGKIGTPFFTTKENGTGLGLAVCYSIVARHNAKIDIETGPTGTTFFVRFKK